MYIEENSPLMQKRAAIYTRFSCDMQRPASLEDQERNCRKYAEEKGLLVLEDFVRCDSAKSGRKLVGREGLNSLMDDAQSKVRPFDVLIVDESSRLARNVEDILRIVKILKHFGIKIVFVGQKLDSEDPSFPLLLNFYGMLDEQNSERMRYRVLRGQEGRTGKGFSTGSRCFGYRSELVPDPNKPDAQSRADMLGTKWIVVDSEAETVRRIFRLFADGLTVSQIVAKLNHERVPAARKPRIGEDRTCWNPTLVKRILKNEKYIGQRIWNKTTQVIHPVTGKIVTRRNPPTAWVHTDVPDLRIVPDELWNRVQERMEIVNEKMSRRRIAGLNRAKKRDYLFSGLLVCGVCGSRINVSKSGNSPAYVCSSWRYKRGCTNNVWISEERLTSQLLAALTKNLLVPEVMNYFVEAVSRDFEQYVKGVHHDDKDSLEGLKKHEATLKHRCAILMEMMMNPISADSTLLPAQLAKEEAELAEVQMRVKLWDAPKTLDDATRDIAAIVRDNVANLLEIIKQDVPKARQVLQRRIKMLQMFPTVTADGLAYEVYGEIDLFTPATGRKKGVLLACSSTGTSQQYTGEVDFIFRFLGVMVRPQMDVNPSPLVEPLAKLLAVKPELLHEPKFAMNWATLLKLQVPPDSKLRDRINDDFVAWNLRNREDQFGDSFGMTTIIHKRMTWYMFSRVGPTEQLAGTRVIAPAGRAAEPIAHSA